MNDTESRLRDYLDAKAATVPNNDQGPGLLAGVTRRRPVWPALAAAAAVIAVLALALTVLPGHSKDQPPVAASPADAAPQLPYIVVTHKDFNVMAQTLYDGKYKVRIPEGINNVRARLDGGWLADYDVPKKGSRVVILQPNGKFRFLGPELASSPVLSPDGQQVAMLVPRHFGDEGGRIAVIDLKSGSETGSLPLPQNLSWLAGWNNRGIFVSSGGRDKAELFVAQPGDRQFQPVTLPGFIGGVLAMDAGTDVIAVGTGTGSGIPEGCLEAGVVRGNKFDVLRKYCHPSEKAVYPVISTDGRTMLHAESGQAVDIATGRTTQLQLPDPIRGYPTAAFEDATHALVVTEPVSSKKGRPEGMYRCDVTTGKCTLLRTQKQADSVIIVHG